MTKTNTVTKAIFVVTLSIVVAFLFAGATAAADQKVFKLKCQTIYPAASPSYAGSVLKVIDLVKERSNGRLIIEPFTADALVPAKEVFNSVERGTLPMGVTVARYFVAKVPMARIAGGLPFSFGNYLEAEYFYKNLGFEKMLRENVLKNHNMYLWIDRVYPTELAIKKPIKSLEDFKGLKLRSSGSIQKFLTALGAAASYLPGPEVYPALSSGVVDGAHWGAVKSNNDMGFYDVCKYTLKPALVYAGSDVWVVNKKTFEELPKDLRDILSATLEEHFWLRTAEYSIDEDIALVKVQKEKGVEVDTLSMEDQNKMRKIAVGIWKEEAGDNPDAQKSVQMLIEYLTSIGKL